MSANERFLSAFFANHAGAPTKYKERKEPPPPPPQTERRPVARRTCRRSPGGPAPAAPTEAPLLPPV